MDTVETYLSRAQDAADLAEAEPDLAARAVLIQIAEAWTRMAEGMLPVARRGKGTGGHTGGPAE